MNRTAIIEEHYNTIKSFFEKYGMKNNISCFTLSELFCCDIILYEKDNEESHGYLFLEDENSIRLYFKENPSRAFSTIKIVNAIIEFKNIISITNGMDLKGRETLKIKYFYEDNESPRELKLYKK